MPKVSLPQDHGRVRAGKYPDVGDQLDALWKGFAAMAEGKEPPGDSMAMLEQIRAVKERFPKRR